MAPQKETKVWISAVNPIWDAKFWYKPSMVKGRPLSHNLERQLEGWHAYFIGYKVWAQANGFMLLATLGHKSERKWNLSWTIVQSSYFNAHNYLVYLKLFCFSRIWFLYFQGHPHQLLDQSSHFNVHHYCLLQSSEPHPPAYFFFHSV